LDVAVLVQDRTPQLEEALLEAAYQVMGDHDFTPLISLKVFDAASFATYQEKSFSFYRKVAEEGIVLGISFRKWQPIWPRRALP